jgi:hypothetical protein
VRLEVGLGHALHLGGRERDARRIVAHVAVERLAQLLQLVEDLLRALALVRGQRHAAVLEASIRSLRSFAWCALAASRPHALEELLVLEELGRERGVLLQAGLGGVAHRLVGWTLPRR